MIDHERKPGTPEAVAAGCTCPRDQVPDIRADGQRVWEADKECPLHGLAALRTELASIQVEDPDDHPGKRATVAVIELLKGAPEDERINVLVNALACVSLSSGAPYVKVADALKQAFDHYGEGDAFLRKAADA